MAANPFKYRYAIALCVNKMKNTLTVHSLDRFITHELDPLNKEACMSLKSVS